jgi:hypothetical protein
MEIYNATGKTKSGELKVSKSVSNLIFATNLNVSELLKENVTIWIERINGSNVFIAQSVKLIDFLMLTNFGSDAIQSNGTFGTIGLCELSGDGAVQLNEGETLKITLDSLNPNSTYSVYAIEDQITTLDLFMFDRKTVGSEDLNKVIDVRSADLAVIDLVPTIKEITFRFENGATVKYLPFELKILSRDIDPVFAITSAGAIVQGLPTKLTFPLVGVVSLEIIKDFGELVEITTRRNSNLLNIE